MAGRASPGNLVSSRSLSGSGFHRSKSMPFSFSSCKFKVSLMRMFDIAVGKAAFACLVGVKKSIFFLQVHETLHSDSSVRRITTEERETSATDDSEFFPSAISKELMACFIAGMCERERESFKFWPDQL